MKTINKLAGLLLFMGLSLAVSAQNGNGQIKGIVLDDQHQPAIGALVKALQGGVIVKQEVTDVDGHYSLKQMVVGKYELLITYTGYKTFRYPSVEVESEQTSYADADMEINTLVGIDVVATKTWEKPVVDKSYITMHSINYDQLSKMAVTKGDVKGMISNISADVLVNKSGQVYSRGSRAGSSKYYVDGELLPFDQDFSGMALQSLSVITGGIPAQYGDLTGAAIVVTYKDYFSGMAEQNIRRNDYKERIKKQKDEEAYEAAKKKREEEIRQEKEAEEKAKQDPQKLVEPK